MSLSAGTRLGPYEIVAAIGQGGMGEVYKATDTRLNRTVALKVMPPHFADDPDMKQRFDREAQTIAGLNHPNICTLHDVGSDAGTSFLVMEFVEGETLADRIARGNRKAATAVESAPSSGSGRGIGIGLDEAIRIAIAMADALDKAHRKGIVHRDLKPANVMLGKSAGAAPVVKLLDFGLAKWVAAEVGSLAGMQTRTDLSSPGMILGTLQYMAPEQVEGKDADARTDIFGFGAVVYEMITGQRAFQGKSQATLISAIMTGEPAPLSVLQPLAPAALDHVIQRCLAKDPDDRWQDAHSVLVQLQWIAQGRTENEVPGAVADANRKRVRTMRIALAAAAVLIAVLAVPAVSYVRGPDPPEAFSLRVPIENVGNFSVAPNGAEIATVAQPTGQESTAIYLRRIDTPVFRKLPDTEGALQPFWSPDSRSIAFVSGGKLRRVDATGSAPKEIAPVSGFSGGAWNGTNTILFGSDKGLFRVSAEGGALPERITELEQPETGHFWPAFLPDDVHYLFLAWSADPSRRAVYIGALGSKEKTKLMAGETNAIYADSAGAGRASGYLLFHREGSLFAQPFDAGSRTLSGVADQVAKDLAFSPSDGQGRFTASATGVLVFYQGRATVGLGRTANEQFAWVTPTGEITRRVIDADQQGDMDLSVDQRFVAITKQDAGAPAADIWVIDIEKGNPFRLTNDPADDINPVWSPTGDRIAFTSYRSGNADIFVRNANGVGQDTPLVQTPADEFVEAWSHDGRFLAYLVSRGEYQDIYVMPMDGDPKPIPAVVGPFHKDEPQFSWDGKWLAYASDESGPGKFEVYVTSFPGLDQKRKMSVGGGGQPRWRRDGLELFYRAVSDYMAVTVQPGPRLDAGVPRKMFSTPTQGGGNASSSDPTRHQWAAAPAGDRFLVRVPPNVGRSGRGGGALLPSATNGQTGGRGRARGQNMPALTVILHWPASLGRAGK